MPRRPPESPSKTPTRPTKPPDFDPFTASPNRLIAEILEAHKLLALKDHEIKRLRAEQAEADKRLRELEAVVQASNRTMALFEAHRNIQNLKKANERLKMRLERRLRTTIRYREIMHVTYHGLPEPPPALPPYQPGTQESLQDQIRRIVEQDWRPRNQP